jgi:hypothetical protein
MPFRISPSAQVTKLKRRLNPNSKPTLRSPSPLCAWVVFAAIAFTAATVASAQETSQQPTGSPSTAQAPNAAPNAPVPPKPVALYNLLQRKSIVFPNIAFNTETLSPGKKFELFIDNSVSIDSVSWAVLGSAVGQSHDSATGFGEGWDAYAERFGTGMARTASSEFFGTFVLASALHQDPRFYPEIKPRLFHAIKYSLKRVFVTRNDDGRDVFNYSGLGGPLMAEGLANVYWPDRNRTAGDTLFRYGLDLASRASGNMFREYWPVLLKKISRTPQPAAGPH